MNLLGTVTDGQCDYRYQPPAPPFPGAGRHKPSGVASTETTGHHCFASLAATTIDPGAPYSRIGDDSYAITRWRRGPSQIRLPSMPFHLVAAAHQATRRIIWKCGAQMVSFALRPGSLLIIPAHSTGVLDCSDNLDISCIFLSCDRLESCARRSGLVDAPDLTALVAAHDPKTAAIIELLAERRHDGADPSRRFIEEGLDFLCGCILDCHIGPSTQAPRRGLAQWQVDRVAAYIAGRLDRPIGLNELAAQVGLSRFHFCTSFRRATGQTPLDWVTMKRIDQAVELLRDETISITDVSLAVGYETPSSFSARFKSRTGMTPSQFRKRLDSRMALP